MNVKSVSKARDSKPRVASRRSRFASAHVGKVLPAQAAALAQSRKAESKRNVVFAIVAAVVALLTVYLLMQPAVALTDDERVQAEAVAAQIAKLPSAEQVQNDLDALGGSDDAQTRNAYLESLRESVAQARSAFDVLTEEQQKVVANADNISALEEALANAAQQGSVMPAASDGNGESDNDGSGEATTAGNQIDAASKVNSFRLWLYTGDAQVYSSGDGGISDTLSYVEDGQTYYLIPVSYFVNVYKGYGYSFDAENTNSCPFRYAPNAYYPKGSLTEAVYVYVNESNVDADDVAAGWYVRVQDTGTYGSPPRSNIYYDPSNSFQLFYGGKTITFNLADENGNPLYGDYSEFSKTLNDATKYVFGEGNMKDQVDDEEGGVQGLSLPSLDGYKFSSARLDGVKAGLAVVKVASVATRGYVNSQGISFDLFQFYKSEPMEKGDWYSKSDSQTISLVYRRIDPSDTASVVTDVAMPSGTVVNLFDYWVNDRENDTDCNSDVLNDGINKNHYLKFTSSGPGVSGSNANKYTGSEAVYAGIVNNVLVDGYPTLSNKDIFWTSETAHESGESQSLSYLFDPADEVQYRSAYRNVVGLFQVDEDGYYYYDSKKNYAEYDSEANKFLLYDTWAVRDKTPGANKASAEGQFFPFTPFSSVDQSTNVQFTDNFSGVEEGELNHYFGLTMTTRFAQQYGGHTDSSKKTDMVFEFSGDDDVWIFIDDVLVADLGGNHGTSSVKIDFSTGKVVVNDDDGSRTIGDGGVVKSYTTTIREAFEAAGRNGNVKFSEDTFADDTYHTLKFFYLERGSYASNLSLKSNLNDYPPTSIYKVDQYGEKVPGAVFAVYAADEKYQMLGALDGKPVSVSGDVCYDLDENSSTYGSIMSGSNVVARALYTGKTDANGEMVFLDEYGLPYTLTDLETMFGTHFVLREISVPEGYRLVSDETHLRIYSNKLLICDNTYESGVFSDASLQVEAPSQLKLASSYGDLGSDPNVLYVPDTGYVVSYYEGSSESNGTLFAVVLKYVGKATTDEQGNVIVDATDYNNLEAALADEKNWAPVWGTSSSGYTVEDNSAKEDGFLQTVINTAQKYTESNNVFALSSRAQMQAEIKGMPGDVTKYYYMLGDNEKNQTQYTVAYYWSSGMVTSNPDGTRNWSAILPANTYRVDPDVAGYSFSRAFGATVNVPNLVNRLIAQKIDGDGELVNGATFALYEVEEDSGIVYYKAGDASIRLYPDDGSFTNDVAAEGKNTPVAGDGIGKAYLKGSESGPAGTYCIDAVTGGIKVTIDSNTYIISAYKTEETITKDAKDDQGSLLNTVGEDGSASFTNMDDGCYILREIAAPEGFELNTSEVKVMVDDTAVYAHAGTSKDGVTVGRGPGYVVSTLDQFASEGEIDNTLTWVYEQMRVSDESLGFADLAAAVKEGEPEDWSYLKSFQGFGFSAETKTTAKAGEALATHLKYNKDSEDALFNYTVNEDCHEDASGVTRRLYTSEGWSYYLLYQDYEYGNKSLTSGANYTDLQGKEISNLFSRSTFVRVADKYNSASLVVAKKVENNSADDLSDQTFKFTISIWPTSPDGSDSLLGSYHYRVYNLPSNSGSETVETGTLTVENDGCVIAPDEGESSPHLTSVGVKDGKAVITVQLKDGQAIRFDGFKPDDAVSYSVTEDAPSNFSYTAVRNDGKAKAAEGSTDNGYWEKQYANGETVTGTLHYYLNAVDFTNYYPVTMHIEKVDSENTNEQLTGARFELYSKGSTDSNDAAGGTSKRPVELIYNESAGVYRVSGAATDSGSNELTAGLATITGLQNGTYILEEVRAPSGYKLMSQTETVEFEFKDGRIEQAWLVDDDGKTTDSPGMISENKLTLSIPNEAGYELPQTGGSGTSGLMIAGALLVVLALVGGLCLARRRAEGERHAVNFQ